MTTWETIISMVVIAVLGSCLYDQLNEKDWKDMTPKRKVIVVLLTIAFAVIWGYVYYIWHLDDLAF